MRHCIYKLFALVVLFLMAQASFAAQYVAGDLAPRTAANSILDMADILILERFLSGVETPTATELLIADVAPVGTPDGILNIADILVLQRAIRGDISLAPVIVIPPTPILNPIATSTTLNPLQITGTAIPLINIDIYVNGVLQQQTISDASGNIVSEINLNDGNNAVYAVASDGVDTSPASNNLTTSYTNNLSRTPSSVITANTVWTPGNPAQAYVLSAGLTVANGASLVLMPGTVVELGLNILTVDGNLVLEAGSSIQSSSSSKIIVNGNLSVNGTAANSVIFASSQTAPNRGNWNGIWVEDGGIVNINYAEIYHAQNGVYFKPGSGGSVTNSKIKNNNFGIRTEGDGLLAAKNPLPIVTNNSFSNTGYYNTENYYADKYANNSSVILNITNNYWGGTDAATIMGWIYHYKDAPASSPYVNLGSILDAEGSNNTIQLLQSVLPQTNVTITGNAVLGGGLTIQTGQTLTLAANSITELGLNILTVDGNLVLEAGSSIQSSSSSKIIVNGNLSVNGTAASTVKFLSSQAAPNRGNWNGIWVEDGGIVNINYAEIYHAQNGVYFKPGSGGSVTNSKIKNNNFGIRTEGDGLLAAKNPLPIVTNNSFSNRGAYNTENYYADKYVNNNTVFLNATNNYWGSTVARTIMNAVYDYKDAPNSSPIVNIGNILDAEGGSSTKQLLHSLLPQNNVVITGGALIGNNLIILAGQTLTFEAGSQIESIGSGATGISVSGNLVANGTPSSHVIFKSSSATPAYFDWFGISVEDGGTVSINYAEISNTQYAVNFKAGSSGSVRNSLIKMNDYGIFTAGDGVNSAKNPLPIVTGNSFYNSRFSHYQAQSYANNSTVFLNATNNYWGSTVARIIMNAVYDYQDAPASSPLVHVGDFLDSEYGQPESHLIHSLLPSANYQVSGSVVVNGPLNIVAGQTLTFAENSVLSLSNEIITVDGSLILEAGSRIESSAYSTIDINGMITINGTLANPVALMSTGTSTWSGLKINPGGVANIDYAIIKNTPAGVLFNNASGYVKNSILTENTYGIDIQGASNPLISGNTIVGNTTGIRLLGAAGTLTDPSPTITGNDIYSNRYANLRLDNIESVLDISGNWWGQVDITAIRATITGSNTDVAAVVLLDLIAASANGASIPQSFVFSGGYISPATSPGSQDTASISATLPLAAAWSVEVRNSSNQLITSFSGSGTAIRADWDGKDNAALIAPDGRYNFNVIVNGSIVERSVQFIVDNTLPQSVFDSALPSTVFNNANSPASITGTAKDSHFTKYIIDVADGATPAEIDFRRLGEKIQQQDNSSLLKNWSFANPYSWQAETEGVKTLRLRVYDLAGNVAVSTVQVTLSHILLLNVISDVRQINPSNNELLNINFDLTFPATVTVRFYPEQDATTANMVAQVSQTFTTPGSKTLSWNGMGLGDIYLPDEAYRYELTAIGATDTTKISVYTRADTLAVTGNCVDNLSRPINAGQNKYINFTCNFSGPARVVRVTTTSTGTSGINRPVDAGSHAFAWDVRDINNKMIDTLFNYPQWITALPLRKDSVIIKGNNPVVTGTGTGPNIEVVATPYTMLHSFEQVAKIVYRLDQDANVSVRLLKPCTSSNTTCTIDHDDPAAVVIFDGVLSAKDTSNQIIDHSFEWRGYDFNAATIDANNILVSEKGFFTFSIKATGVISGLSTIYRGSIYLGY